MELGLTLELGCRVDDSASDRRRIRESKPAELLFFMSEEEDTGPALLYGASAGWCTERNRRSSEALGLAGALEFVFAQYAD